MTEILEASAEVLAPANQERCIKPYVQIAEKSAKFHLNLQREDQYIAGTACPNTENPGFKIYSFFAFLSLIFSSAPLDIIWF